jgi:hypothetical protein
MNLSRAIAILPVAVALGLAAHAQSADTDPKATASRIASAPVATPVQSNSAPAATSSGQAAEIDLSAKPSGVVLNNGGSTKALSYSWNNGPFVTGTGNGAGGADTSAIQTGFGTFGYGQQGGTINNRLADDFEVPAGQTVALNDMLWRTYQTGSTTAGSITGINVNIWNSAPLTGGTPDESGPANSFVAQAWTGVYRVTSTTLTNATRPIINVTTDMSWVDPLPAGTFWVDATLTGTLASGPWGPPTTPNDPGTDNGRQFIGSTATWAAVIDATSTQPQDFPFLLSGAAYTSGCSWENGPYITGIGNGAGGANTSAIQTGFGTFGYGQQGGTINNRLADDFVVPSGDAWTLQELLWKTYQTGSTTVGTITGLNSNLWNSAPLTGGTPDQTGPANTLLSQVWTGVYRVTSTTLTNATRPIIDVTADMSWASVLTPGTFWVDVSLTGSLASGPWGPPTTPNDPGTDNGRQFIGSTATWAAVIDATSTQPQDFLFGLTAACAGETPEYYCASKTTSCGSVPAIFGPDGLISQAAQGAGTFDVTLGLVEPGTFGIIIYSTDGKSVPPVVSAYGTLCIGNTFRVNPPSTGVGGPCAATYTFDFGTYLATQSANPALTPAGLAVSGGAVVDMQVWYRDPPNVGGANLSNAMRFVVLP